MPVIDIPKEFFKHDAQAGGFFPNTHTNPGFDIEKFIGGSGQNYLIEGIRGTGKTHILKMINERCLETFNERRILPVYVSLASVSEWIERDLALFRIHLYSNIVIASINTIEKNRDSIALAGNSDLQKSMKRVIQMFGLNSDENFDFILSKIKDLNTTLLNKLSYNPSEFMNKSIETLKESTTFDVKTTPIQLTIQDYLESIEHKEVKYVGKNLSHENASSFIVSFFNELKVIFNHSYSFILLDECSEVSKNAQIEIFRLLKLIRGAFGENSQENTAYFCASVYPTPITYYPSKTMGDSFNFDVGHDAIMEYVSLDELADDYLIFYQELTRKRISEFLKKNFKITNYLDIFENEKAFTLAAYCSNGNVRRYIEVLKHAYDNLCQRFGAVETVDTKKITLKDIEEGVDIVVSNQILSHNKLTQKDFEILDDITSRITKRNKKNETENKQKLKASQLPANLYFTVSRSESLMLGNLFIQGVLHDKGKTRLKKYHKEGGTRGVLIVFDLSVAFYHGAIDRTRAGDIFLNDLKENAKSGYLWCQDFQIKNE
jgi:hypothetical protein